MAVTVADTIERYRLLIGEKLGVRTEMEPALEITKDPMVTIRHLPPARREFRVNDEGTGKLWFRGISLTVFLSAEGSQGKVLRKACAAVSETLYSLFVNDDDGGDFTLDESGTWYCTWQGIRRAGEALGKDETGEGSFKWNESWDVILYVPESAFA